MSSTLLLPMLLASLCAAVCSLISRCRTHGSALCEAVMFVGMVDLCFTHQLPPPLIATGIVITSAWSHLYSDQGGTWRYRLSRAYRLAAAGAMAYLVLEHQHMSAMKGSLCLSSSDLWVRVSAHLQLAQGSACLALVMLTLGAALAVDSSLSTARLGHPLRDRLAALEPLFAGAALALMVL